MFWIILCAPFYVYLGLCGIWLWHSAVVASSVIACYFHRLVTVKLKFDSRIFAYPLEEGIKIIQHPRNAMRIHRIMNLGICMAMNSWSKMLMVFHFVIIAGLSFGMYFLAGSRGPGYERVVVLIIVSILGSYATFLLHMLGKVNSSSLDLLSSWKHEYIGHGREGRQCEIDGRVLRSLPPFRIYAGTTYYFDKKVTLNLWDIIIDKSIFLLCSPQCYLISE